MKSKTDDEWIPRDGEEQPEQPMGLDPQKSSRICRCGAQFLDLGKETATQYTRERRWYKCSGCGQMETEVIGPARAAREDYSCLHDLKQRGII